MAIASFVADQSALARLHQPPVYSQWAPYLERGLVATCSIVDLEVLYSCRSPSEYRAVSMERAALERLDTGQQDWDRAHEVQALLAGTSQHRTTAIPDLLIAAVAERHRVIVLHYDHYFDRIAAVTGQRVQWVVPAGTVA